MLKTVLFYSVLILVLPIGSFFATKSLLFEWFLGQVCLDLIISLLAYAWFFFAKRALSLQTATIGTNIVSAVVAVIVLHLALGLFIYKVGEVSLLKHPTWH